MQGYGGALHADHGPHHHLHLPHPHWGTHLHQLSPHHLHWGSHTAHSAAAHVGRTGTLAFALGFGTTAVTGFCLVCGTAYADTAPGSSSGGSTTSTSQSVEAARRGPRSAVSSVSANTIRTPVGAAHQQVARATSTRRSPIAIDLPDAVMAPTQQLETLSAVPKALQPASLPVVSGETSLGLLWEAKRRDFQAPAVPRLAAIRAVAAATSTTTTGVEAEKMTIAQGSLASAVFDNRASGRSAMALSGTGAVSATLSIPESSALTIRARTGSGSPTMTVSVDGVAITTVVVSSTSYADYVFAGKLSAGSHVVSVSSANATATSTLYLDKLSTTVGVIGDQFTGKSGSAANSAIWTTITGTGWDTGIQNYVSSGAYQDGAGHLVIQSTRTPSGGYTSGRVQTANKVSFGYGTVTARIQVPKGQALWPAFWMVGADEATNGWPGVGEIDVMELPSTTTTMYSTIHGPVAGTTVTQQAQIISTLPDLSTGYHDYWVRHLPDQITFGVDNQTLGTLTPADLAPGETWVYNRPMSVILNLAVGGPWAGAPDATTPATAKMLVDSITYMP